MIRSLQGRSFRFWLFIATLANIACGVVLIALAEPQRIWGDGYFYHHSANIIADGHGWINPIHFNLSGTVIQAADHPPTYILYLVAFSALGLTSILAHQYATVLITAACIPLFGLLGRRIGGQKVGIIAAFVGALHPAIWGWSQMVMSEPTAVLSVLLLLLVAIKWRDTAAAGLPLTRITCAFGFVIGFGALARAELLLTGVVLAFICFAERRVRSFAKHLVVAGVVSAVTISPWVVFNLSRFEETVLLSNGAQITLAATNCPETYGGQFQAFWLIQCSERATKVAREKLPGADQSVIMNEVGRQALQFVSDNKVTAAKTVFLRMGRVLGLYRPLQQINFDHFPEGRIKFVAVSSWIVYFLMLPFVIAGALLLRKRNRLLPILLAPVGVALFTCATTFGNTRYRMSAESSLVIFASLALFALGAALKRWWGQTPEKVN